MSRPQLQPLTRAAALSLAALCLSFRPGGAVPASQAPSSGPAVHAILFYSPNCPHCHEVMNVTLPPILERFGESLEVVGVNTHTERGAELYRATVEHFSLGPRRQGVPMLLVGDRVLLGSGEIPDLLPGIVEAGLATGGIGWPGVPLVREALVEAGRLAPGEEPGDGAAESASGATSLSHALPTGLPSTSSILTRFGMDPVGNSLAVVVLLGMLSVLAYVGRRALAVGGGVPAELPAAPWLPGALAVGGLVVAGYLVFVEVSGSAAVCGPVGNCNAVQQSEYARLFGVVHVGVLGVVGYAAMLGAWLAAVFGAGKLRSRSAALLWLLALAGAALSVYLTYLEPFIIGATCAWCLASALFVTSILWVTTDRTPLETGLRSRRR